MEKSSYFPKDRLGLIAKILASLSTSSLLQFVENMTLDLWLLTFWQDLQLNSWRVGIVILGVCSSKKGKIISKEKMGDFWASLADFNREPFSILYFSVNASGESLHTYYQDVWRYRISLSDAPTRFEILSPAPLTSTEIEDVEIQNIISLVVLLGKPKESKVSLMKDHSNLSKAFSRSIFRVKLVFLPFIFLKWLMYSFTIMALLQGHLFDRKLDWLSPMIEGNIGFILLTMILIISLYIVLQSPISLNFFNTVALAHLGIRHMWVVLTSGFISSLWNTCL